MKCKLTNFNQPQRCQFLAAASPGRWPQQKHTIMTAITNTIKTAILFQIGCLLFQCTPKPGNSQVTTTDGINNKIEIEKVVSLATNFKSLLNEQQRKILLLTYSKTDAAKWSNFPNPAHPVRVGISFAQLDSTQIEAAKTLMAYVLDKTIRDEGYDEVEGILAADDLLETLPNKDRIFGSENYFIAFLGEPSTTGLWELQFGGHHLAVSNTYNNGKLVGMTPSFRGVEPMAPIEGKERHYLPMEGEKLAFQKMIEALNEEERNGVRLSGTFSDIFLGPGKDNGFPSQKQGLKVGLLSKDKQALVLQAMRLYVKDIASGEADKILATYAKELNETYIGFSGTTTLDKIGDYVRIDGPGVWIEYNTQPSRDMKIVPTHPHSIWRDRRGDYGGQ